MMLAFQSCDKLGIRSREDDSEDPLVAEAGDAQLRMTDLAGIVPRGMNATDSASLVDRYIRSWVRKQLLISQASEEVDYDKAELERKILDYRYALMVYEFQKQYINENLDTAVSNEEVKAYYDINQDNFQLKQNIIRGWFLKVPKDAPKLAQIKQMMRKPDAENKKELKSYAFRFAMNYSMEDSLWLNFDEVIANTPFMSIPNKVQFLESNTFAETDDEKFEYLLHIQDYKISDQTSPLEFVKDDIRNIIINKRKVALADQLERNIYEEAKDNNEFEIYSIE
ncbi:peptidyl-prolyl cis-trans isomerase [Roseivirga sp. BDSF3-8]|uniref:peptidyl-prolyl cis-trans isomerase n=1 Tax=Roseivirga sp. BDSF3-8 TaxID=3241598 RepID=UPI003531E3C4